jgi:hypothetical protein
MPPGACSATSLSSPSKRDSRRPWSTIAEEEAMEAVEITEKSAPQRH